MAISDETSPNRRWPILSLRLLATTIGVAALQFAGVIATGLFVHLMPAETAWGWWVPLWIPAGTAMALVLCFGPIVAPGIWLGALLGELHFGSPLLAWTMLPLINTLCPILVYWGLKRLHIQASEFLSTTHNAFVFLALMIVVEALFCATVGSVLLDPTIVTDPNTFFLRWGRWALGNISADLVVGVALFCLIQSVRRPHERPRLASWIVIVAGVIGAAFLFSDWTNRFGLAFLPASFALFPLAVWSGLRQRQSETALLVMAIALTVSVSTAMGHGIFAAAGPPKLNSLVLQAFLFAFSLTAFLLSAANGERLSVNRKLENMLDALDLLVAERTAALNAANDQLKAEIKDGRRTSAIMRGHSHIMQMLAKGATREAMLEALVCEFRRIEPQFEAAILLRSESTEWRVVAGPSSAQAFALFARRLAQTTREDYAQSSGGETAPSLMRKRLAHAFSVGSNAKDEAALAAIHALTIPLGLDDDDEALFCVRGKDPASRGYDVDFVADTARLAGIVLTHTHSMDRLHHAASHDFMTGLLNRHGFFEQIGSLCETRPGTQGPDTLTMLFIDLDGFKAINDQLGHEIGDRLLIEIAQRFKETLGHDGPICRLGGDEFVVALIGDGDARKAEQIAERLILACQNTRTLENTRLRVTPSIGIAQGNRKTRSPSAILDQADAAMYAAKREGGDRIRLFESAPLASAAIA
ncbi:diguanylate cyclase domain-containing protein [Jiella marina]|uniref:diguanylate cyclase domain-containing protein n=1 Tax=Jiella sp. LLJ827 TaxID=2917712 RepID=UPI002101C57C|nr:diguanylate cyclase [Jiella sp. LLJ827]MCQ0989689.1 sensor domain-containing diguanylate cyclase [Jiella sp. LLJ827]